MRRTDLRRDADEYGSLTIAHCDGHSMDARQRHGGDLVVECLQALGATHVFGLPGQHALPVFDALQRSDIAYIGARTENNAAFAADAYARRTGSVAPLLVSTGPGALMTL